MIAARQHDLKVAPEFWDDLETQKKNFEIRYAGDRDFRIGDLLRLREWRGDTPPPEGERWTKETGYSGREIVRRITYILKDEKWGLRRDYAVLSIEAVL